MRIVIALLMLFFTMPVSAGDLEETSTDAKAKAQAVVEKAQAKADASAPHSASRKTANNSFAYFDEDLVLPGSVR